MKKIISIILALLPAVLFAQSAERQVIAGTGDYDSTATMQVSSTTGEAVITTGTTGTIIITQGFQQPDKGSTVGIEDPQAGFSVNAYPNPASGSVTLDFTSQRAQQLRVDVVDVLGKSQLPVENIKVNGTMKHILNLSGIAAGNYFIRLSNTDGSVNRTIQIQKMK